jgi:hypothetical protein
MTGRALRCVTARCAAAAVLLHGTVLADTYQYDLRSRFIREVDEKELPPGLDLQPRIDSALLFVGNINLAENSADEIDVAGIEAAPGLYATYRSNRADASLDYSLIGRAFEDEDYDSVSHELFAHGRYMLVQDLFFVNAHAGYSDSIIDASRSTNYGGTGLFDRSNIAETGRASITPNLTHQFGGFQFDASYTYGRVWYFESDDVANPDPIFLTGFNEDSEDQRAYVSLGTREPDNAATLKAFYEWQESTYETSLPYKYERTGLDTSLRLTRTLRLVADGGVESDLTEDTTDGGLDTEFWHAGFRWQPDRRTYFDARYGERFFGDSYSLEARVDGRWLTLTASYVEDPEVETRRIGLNFDPDDVPLPPSPDFSFLSAQPYVRKDAVLTAIAEGARTQLRLDLYNRKREYIQLLVPDEELTGVLFNVARDFGRDFYGEFEARYDDSLRGQRTILSPVPPLPLEPILFHSYDRDFLVRLTWEAYRNFTTSAEAGYLASSGDRRYDGEWLAFRFRYTF